MSTEPLSDLTPHPGRRSPNITSNSRLRARSGSESATTRPTATGTKTSKIYLITA